MTTLPLTMTATVERTTATGTDPDGHPTGSPDIHTVACWVFHPAKTLETAGDEVNVLVDELRMLVAFDADVTENDVITQVTNANGEVMESRRMKVTGFRRRGDGLIAISHRALTLEAIS